RFVRTLCARPNCPHTRGEGQMSDHDFFPSADELRRRARDATEQPEERARTNRAMLEEFAAKTTAAGLTPAGGYGRHTKEGCWPLPPKASGQSLSLEACEPPALWLAVTHARTDINTPDWVEFEPVALAEDPEVLDWDPAELHRALLSFLPS